MKRCLMLQVMPYPKNLAGSVRLERRYFSSFRFPDEDYTRRDTDLKDRTRRVSKKEPAKRALSRDSPKSDLIKEDKIQETLNLSKLGEMERTRALWVAGKRVVKTLVPSAATSQRTAGQDLFSWTPEDEMLAAGNRGEQFLVGSKLVRADIDLIVQIKWSALPRVSPKLMRGYDLYYQGLRLKVSDKMVNTPVVVDSKKATIESEPKSEVVQRKRRAKRAADWTELSEDARQFYDDNAQALNRSHLLESFPWYQIQARRQFHDFFDTELPHIKKLTGTETRLSKLQKIQNRRTSGTSETIPERLVVWLLRQEWILRQQSSSLTCAQLKNEMDSVLEAQDLFLNRLERAYHRLIDEKIMETMFADEKSWGFYLFKQTHTSGRLIPSKTSTTSERQSDNWEHTAPEIRESFTILASLLQIPSIAEKIQTQSPLQKDLDVLPNFVRDERSFLVDYALTRIPHLLTHCPSLDAYRILYYTRMQFVVRELRREQRLPDSPDTNDV